MRIPQIKTGCDIKELREKLGVPQSFVSELTGLDQATISDIETGKHKPRLETFSKLKKGILLAYSARLRPVDLAYWAGLFDGEGCVFISKSKKHYQAGVNLSNTDENIIRALKDSFGGRFYSTHPKGNRKPAFIWQAWGETALNFLTAIKPYVRVKPRRVEIGIGFLEMVGQHPVVKGHFQWQPISNDEKLKRDELLRELQELNHRGK